MNRTHYIPPLRFHALSPLYDWAVSVGLRAEPARIALVRNARLSPAMRVLDLGCGTGLLSRTVWERHGGSRLAGLDPDGPSLARARGRSGAKLCRGLGGNLPFLAGCFDRVLSSLVFHHLDRDAKIRVFHEVRRVLKPGGELHFADFTRPHTAIMALCSVPVRLFDGWAPTHDNFSGNIPDILVHAGFEAVTEHERFATSCGTLAVFSAVKSPG